MNYVVIANCPPWDGKYEFDDFSFTNGELQEIKVISKGIRAGELIEALELNDTAAYVAVATVVMARRGMIVDQDDLWNAKVGSISIDLGVEEVAAEADPPELPDAEPELVGITSASGGDSTLGGD